MSEKEIQTVEEFIASLRVAEPQSYKNLTILPLMSSKTKDLRLKTLEEALSEGTIEITEIDGGGTVPKLKFVNSGGEAVLILQGSIIKGNLQDRAIKTSFVVYPHTEVSGDVFCIESSRWRPIRGQKAYKPDRHLSADIRMDFSKNNQSSVWRKIQEKRQRMNIQSHTDSADYIYENYQEELEEFKRAFLIKPDYVGIIGLIEGKPVAMDISGVKEIFHKQFPDLISSFVIDALDSDYCKEIKKQKGLTVEQFLRAVARAKKEEREAIGGTEIRFESDEVVGGALVDHDHDVVVQLEAFLEVV